MEDLVEEWRDMASERVKIAKGIDNDTMLLAIAMAYDFCADKLEAKLEEWREQHGYIKPRGNQ